MDGRAGRVAAARCRDGEPGGVDLNGAGFRGRRSPAQVSSAVWGAVLACWMSVGCTHPPVVVPDAADMLTTLARNQVSSQGPTRELAGDRLEDVPQGSRCVVETTDSNPLRVVSGTVLMVSPVELVLREGTVRRLDRRRLDDSANSESLNGINPDLRLREAIEEQRFEELRLAVSEIRRVSVYEAPQGSWTRLSEGDQPRGTAPGDGSRPGRGAAASATTADEPEIDLEGWRPANRGP